MQKSFLKYLAIYIAPVVLGSLLFSGAINKYNNESTYNKLILESGIIPFGEIFYNCSETNRDLLEEYLKLAIKINLEMKNIKNGKINNSINHNVGILHNKVEGCNRRIIAKMDEIVYLMEIKDKFNTMKIYHENQINKLIKERDLIGENTLRENLNQLSLDESNTKNILKAQVDAFQQLNRLVTFALEAKKIEEQIFNARVNFYADFEKLYSKEFIKRKNKGLFKTLIT